MIESPPKSGSRHSGRDKTAATASRKAARLIPLDDDEKSERHDFSDFDGVK